MAAERLRVCVREAGRVVADLTFPARATASIGDMIPDGLAARLQAGGIDPGAIGRRAVEAGCPSGDLFVLGEGTGKQVRVWLE